MRMMGASFKWHAYYYFTDNMDNMTYWYAKMAPDETFQVKKF